MNIKHDRIVANEKNANSLKQNKKQEFLYYIDTPCSMYHGTVFIYQFANPLCTGFPFDSTLTCVLMVSAFPIQGHGHPLEVTWVHC